MEKNKNLTELDDLAARLAFATEATAKSLEAIFVPIRYQAQKLERFFKSDEGKRMLGVLGEATDFLQKAEARIAEQERISHAIAAAKAERFAACAEAQERIAAALEFLEDRLDENKSQGDTSV